MKILSGEIPQRTLSAGSPLIFKWFSKKTEKTTSWYMISFAEEQKEEVVAGSMAPSKQIVR